jgi:thiol-disulfide isomerase/thioredoxin
MQPSSIGAPGLVRRVGDGALKVRATDPQEKHMLNRWTVVTAAALCVASGAMAQESAATLKVGDNAPKLSVENWVKGKKVEKFEAGKVYVVEFWATWCPPCVKSIPHLTKLQKEYKSKDVTIIGVASSEKGGDAKSNLSGVENFVKKKGDEMEYTVAFDEDRSMSKDWMTPAAQRGIPCAFVVGGDGKIAWIGNPLVPEGEIDAQVKKAVEANKRLGSTKPESSTQVASSNGG